MQRDRLPGALWLVAAVVAVLVTVGFRDHPNQVLSTIALAVVAAGVGALLLARPSPIGTWVSVGCGALWLLLYAALTYVQRGEIAAAATDVFVGILGIVAAFGSYRQRTG